jgi:hypothetical protein
VSLASITSHLRNRSEKKKAKPRDKSNNELNDPLTSPNALELILGLSGLIVLIVSSSVGFLLLQ